MKILSIRVYDSKPKCKKANGPLTMESVSDNYIYNEELKEHSCQYCRFVGMCDEQTYFYYARKPLRMRDDMTMRIEIQRNRSIITMVVPVRDVIKNKKEFEKENIWKPIEEVLSLWCS